MFQSNIPQSVVLFPPAGINPQVPQDQNKQKKIKRQKARILFATALAMQTKRK